MDEQWEPWMDQAAVNAVWAHVDESPEWIAERTELMTLRISEDLPLESWSVPELPPRLSVPWPGGGPEGAALVRAHRADGVNEEANELFGYAFSLFSQSPEMGLHAMISAGGSHVGYRTPLHACTIDFLPMDDELLVPEDADAVLAACVEAWDPLMVSVSSAEVNRIARRGNWLVPPAYRLWLASSAARVTQTVPGVTAHEFGAGTLLAVDDDDMPPDQLVGVMLDVLRVNGIDELPH